MHGVSEGHRSLPDPAPPGRAPLAAPPLDQGTGCVSSMQRDYVDDDSTGNEAGLPPDDSPHTPALGSTAHVAALQVQPLVASLGVMSENACLSSAPDEQAAQDPSNHFVTSSSICGLQTQQKDAVGVETIGLRTPTQPACSKTNAHRSHRQHKRRREQFDDSGQCVGHDDSDHRVGTWLQNAQGSTQAHTLFMAAHRLNRDLQSASALVSSLPPRTIPAGFDVFPRSSRDLNSLQLYTTVQSYAAKFPVLQRAIITKLWESALTKTLLKTDSVDRPLELGPLTLDRCVGHGAHGKSNACIRC